MTQDATQPILTAVFVDYDNIYLSLKKRSEEAAKRFAKDAVSWIKEIESGRLITATNSPPLHRPRRIVVNRCYGNPVPRRNPHDNSTDMTSFPFVRHHFLRAGFEVVDCPPLTAQLKNSSDIKMVMDATDFLDHDTRFDEFLILSGDADFTPLLHRLRAYDRRTAIFANDYTAAAYTSLCDGEIKETSLMAVLLEGRLSAEPAKGTPATSTASISQVSSAIASPAPALVDHDAIERTRAEIVAAVVVAVRAAGSPVPLEALAERTTRALGHERTVGTNWAGSSSFLELLRRHLPPEIRLTEQPPYLAYEAARAIAAPTERPMPILDHGRPAEAVPTMAAPPPQQQQQARSGRGVSAPLAPAPIPQPPIAQAPVQQAPREQSRQPSPVPHAPNPHLPMHQSAAPAQAAQPVQAAMPRQADMAAAIQASIARIHDACQAPPLSPPDYRVLFEEIAKEINEDGLQGGQTLNSIHGRAQSLGLNVSRDDIRFVMEVVSEADPWFEQGASANLFAGRFRNFVVARCRSQNLNLSSDELDLIDAWFAGTNQQIAPQAIRVPAQSASMPANAAAELGAPTGRTTTQPSPAGAWSNQPQAGSGNDGDQFPKILRTRLRG